jgi:two-component system, cell cycle response regulator DivK
MSKILYVEDEEDNRTITSHRLMMAGHQVLLAEDTVEGLAMARSEMPDFILMDLKIKDDETAGLEATRALKADPKLRHIPVIAVTAFTEAEKRTASLLAGCEDHVVRPIDFPRLLKRIEALVAANQNQTAADKNSSAS